MLSSLAAAVRAGAIDPVDLVQESLRRIEASQRDLNAVVDLRPAEDALDEAARSSRTGLLAGLPVLVKDLGRCAGMRTTMGSTLFADAPADDVDDIALARLRAAGAIVVGRTNTPAFGSSAVTTNALFGSTRNPWNTTRSPGGSSGGSAAALAAGLAPLATGSDGGGSVRIPASCCGLVGYKPTLGAIGRSEVPSWMSFAATGVMGASVADVVLEAGILMGAVVGDLLSFPEGCVRLDPMMPSTILATRSFRSGVDPVIQAAFDELVVALTDAGPAVREIDSPFDGSSVRAWLTISSADLAQSLSWCRDRWSEFETSTQNHLAFGASARLDDYIAAHRQRFVDAARIDALLGGSSVLIVPTVNVISWPAEGPFPTAIPGVIDDPFVGLNTPELNLTNHPAVSVPLGVDPDGVPFGVQIVAPRHCDGLALGVAALIERIRPWPLVATGYASFGCEFGVGGDVN